LCILSLENWLTKANIYKNGLGVVCHLTGVQFIFCILFHHLVIVQRQSPSLQTVFSVQQAVENAPSLARLAALVKQSRDQFSIIEPLIPQGLRSAVQAGPIDGNQWCLLVNGNASAAKIRQLLPKLQNLLQLQGCVAASIRLKIMLPRSLR